MIEGDKARFRRLAAELRAENAALRRQLADCTRRLARAEDAAARAHVAKWRSLAAASHDLLQPLNAARLFNSTLRAGQQEPLRTVADRVESSLATAEELLDSLLDIARLDSEAFLSRPVVFAVCTLLESLHVQFEPVARQRGIELCVMRTSAVVFTDPGLLRRILQNLIANALKFTRSGRVTIGVRNRFSHGRVELQVCDTGPGIAPDCRELIFEEFRRLPCRSPWGEQGLGLGLSICKRIATLLDTPLTLSSRVGHGSIFGVQVNLADDRARAAGRSGRPACDCSPRASP